MSQDISLIGLRSDNELFRIHSDFERPDPALIEAIGKLPTANLSDAAGNLNTLHSEIGPLKPDWRLCGTATTVTTRAGDFLAILTALYFAKAGDVLVIDSQANPDTAVWGEITTAEAVRKGLAGLLTDGKVRDIEGIRAMDFPVFARGTTPRVAGRSALGEVNVPISCGGVLIMPGDIVVGDADGVVVVPRARAPEILRLGQDIVSFENALLAKVRSGVSQVEFYGLEGQLRSLREAHIAGHQEFTGK